MEGGPEFRWRIDAYTPETMPLARLAEYLSELAKILGEDHSIHLVQVEPGSTVLVHRIDPEAVPKIRERVAAVRRGDAPASAMHSYNNVNKLLRDDGASASLLADGAEILEFPGKMAKLPHFPAISERGEIDGEILRVGGASDPVPILLATEAGVILSGCRHGAVSQSRSRFAFSNRSDYLARANGREPPTGVGCSIGFGSTAFNRLRMRGSRRR
ncbi:MAG: hypothetical protein WA417_16230 [Stellaceae bacterium]